MGIIFKIFRKLIFWAIIISVASYWIVPPIAEMLSKREPKITTKKTVILNSDQPSKVKLTKEELILHRAKNLDTYLGIVASTLIHLPAVAVDYFSIYKKFPKIPKESFGMSVDAGKAPINRILEKLKEINITSTAIRVYLTPKYLNSQNYEKNLKLAEELKKRGFSVMLVLAQLRESFNFDIYSLVGKVIRDFEEFVDFYQVGEAVNRDKWGVVNRKRFKRLITDSYNAIIAYDPEAKIIAPAVIDFEWYYSIYYLNLAEEFIDIQSSLLYVDRVREPENSQNGFDTVDKIHLLNAIAPEKPLWITEVNWPLKNTGSFRPTSLKEAVTPKKYRDYMLRYLIMVLSDGSVERVYWWQLFAKGYGLIDHVTGKRYPAFHAYKKLVALLSGSQVVSKERKQEGRNFEYKFKKGDAEFLIIWNRDGGISKPPTNRKCFSFDDEVKNVVSIGATPVVCGDKLTMEYLNRIFK
jgi:hypothetical protein